MYNQDGFFFLSVKGGLPRVSRYLRGGVSPHHCLAPPHPAQWDRGHTGEREIASTRQFREWDGDGVTLPDPPGSAERLGRVREDGPCPKLHQHPRSSSPKITHTHLPETKNNIYCIVLLSAVLK